MKPISQQGITSRELMNTSVAKSNDVDKGNVEASQSPAKEQAVNNSVTNMASLGAPVDSNKVETIKAAIADGLYSIDAGEIAVKMIDHDKVVENIK